MYSTEGSTMDQGTLISELVGLISLRSMLEVVLVIAVAVLLVVILKRLMHILEGRFYRYRFQNARIFPLMRILVWFTATSIILFHILRLSQNMVFSLFASLGIAVGLAAQDIIRNWLAGLVMLFTRPYQLGDRIHALDYYGEVIEIDMMATQLRTFDANVVTLPNAELLRQAVTNANSGGLAEMVVIPTALPATVDTALVRELAWESAVCSPYIYLKNPIAIVAEDHFERTFLTHFHIKAYVVDVRLERLLASDIVERFKREVVRRGMISEQLMFDFMRLHDRTR